MDGYLRELVLGSERAGRCVRGLVDDERNARHGRQLTDRPVGGRLEKLVVEVDVTALDRVAGK
jgi:hypothetical protein